MEKSWWKRLRANSWRNYQIAVPIVLAIVLLLGKTVDGGSHFARLSLVVYGFFLGWLSGVIAHYVYPK